MSAPIIPAELWPEWADRHCWDERGIGQFIGIQTDKYSWRKWAANSGIPRPSGWDWRVPVMRHQANAIDLEQFTYSVKRSKSCLENHLRGALEVIAREIADCDRLLALIDAHKGE